MSEPEVNQPPGLLERALSTVPEIIHFFVETVEAAGAVITQAPSGKQRKELREAVLSGERLIKALKLADIDDTQFEQMIDELLAHIFPDDGGAPGAGADHAE